MRQRGWRPLVVALVSATTLAATSCGAAKSGPAADDEAERAAPAAKLGAVIKPVPAKQWDAMVAAGMVRPGCPVTEASQLRRVEVDYVDFNGRDQRGHLVVNADTAKTTARIFTKLYDEKFPIKRMEGVENYKGDTLLSLRADNTSGYNCRRPDQINAPVMESPHANGRAIDINPVENPWMDVRCDCWSPSAEFAKRSPGQGKILRGGTVWQIFKDEGWIWQNIPVPDYMHFDTGYPSVPYKESQRVR